MSVTHQPFASGNSHKQLIVDHCFLLWGCYGVRYLGDIEWLRVGPLDNAAYADLPHYAIYKHSSLVVYSSTYLRYS